MAKKFACKNMGLECNFEATAETEEALLTQAKEHAKTAHGMAEADEAMLSKMKAAIQEA